MGLEAEIQMMLSRGVVSGSPGTTQAVVAGEPTEIEFVDMSQIMLARIAGREDAVLRLANELANKDAGTEQEPGPSALP